MDLRLLLEGMLDGIHSFLAPQVSIRDVHTIANNAGMPLSQMIDAAETKAGNAHDLAAAAEVHHTRLAKAEARERRRHAGVLRAVARARRHTGH